MEARSKITPGEWAYLFPVVLLVGASVGWLTTPHKAVATVAYGAMLCGILARSNRSRHGAFMGLAMALDVGLVLLLELTRQATRTAAGPGLGLGQQIHVAGSLLAVVLYAPLLWLGFKGHRAPGWHRRLGLAAFSVRTIGFVFMFTMHGIVRP